MPNDRDEKCPICSKELYSITTRRIGENAVCIDCGDALSALVTEILNDLIMKCKIAKLHNINIKMLIPTLISDYQLGDEQKELILMVNT